MNKKIENITISVCKKGWKDFTEEELHWDLPGTDLVYYPEIVLEYMDQEGRALVPVSLLDKLEMTQEEFMAAAVACMEKNAIMQSMSDYFTGGNEDTGLMFPPMLIITNNQHWKGAGAIVSHYLLDQARELLGTDEIFLLPSSTHEILAVPTTLGTAEYMAQMVSEINNDVVAPEERLSDHAYLYDGYQVRTA